MANGNGNTVSRLGERLIAALPPAFLLLCVVVIAFLAIIMWGIDRQAEHRAALLNEIIERCMPQGQ
jgi:hypothetical protein